MNIILTANKWSQIYKILIFQSSRLLWGCNKFTFDPNILTYDYIFIITLFAGVSFVYNLASGFLRSIGNSFIPLIFLVFSAVLNIGLDMVFIIVLGLGIKGAAYATVISQSFAAILSVVYIWKKEHELIPERKHFHVGKELYNELLGQGLSMAMMVSFVIVGTVVLQYAINQMGYLIIAGHTTARRIVTLCMMPMSSFSISLSTFVSQNKGANKGKRILEAYKYANIISVFYCLVIIVTIWLFSKDLMMIISGSREQILIDNGSNYLKFNLSFFLILGPLFLTRYALQGLGEKLTPLISSIIELVLKFAFVLWIIPVMGYTGVIISEPIIWIFMTIQLLYSFYSNPYIKSIHYKTDG